MDSFRSHVKIASSNTKIALKKSTIANPNTLCNELSGDSPAASRTINKFLPEKPNNAIKKETASNIFQLPVHIKMIISNAGSNIPSIICVSSYSTIKTSY